MIKQYMCMVYEQLKTHQFLLRPRDFWDDAVSESSGSFQTGLEWPDPVWNDPQSLSMQESAIYDWDEIKNLTITRFVLSTTRAILSRTVLSSTYSRLSAKWRSGTERNERCLNEQLHPRVGRAGGPWEVEREKGLRSQGSLGSQTLFALQGRCLSSD